jgi:hypothetical protein
MRVRNSLWLRLLLGLVLVVNGTALARAAVPAAADADCPAQHAAMQASATMPVDCADHDSPTDHGHAHAGDCCGPACGGMCCMPAALTMSLAPAGRAPHAVLPPEPAFAYAPSHSLPLPFRPPIA